ncbi:hypothetical protein DPX16_21274 [Anabarilius grahami]|uniref:Uncharacterized protein n=1 Tax=Anabarilius grahami TaxID=495550 RepID=A0A3N0XU47_ANAGA|nr:hypothetical protein DPX16_21274 [Anabarilius grahami]
MASVSDASLPLFAGEDTFELHAVQWELEAVERQIQTLLEKQAELRERQTALETSRADAQQSSVTRPVLGNNQMVIGTSPTPGEQVLFFDVGVKPSYQSHQKYLH